MTAAVYLAGICLLAGCGAGAGWLLARRSREQWRPAAAGLGLRDAGADAGPLPQAGD